MSQSKKSYLLRDYDLVVWVEVQQARTCPVDCMSMSMSGRHITCSGYCQVTCYKAVRCPVIVLFGV